MRDEAEIRGHRRTYVGAMPGTIIRALRDAGSRNPVFMIDEIDKMGADFRGDPASAMLEVLDPSQNDAFRDHYLDLDFDLSEVIFIATANVLDPVPAPLRDRMEVIDLSGYTVDEKLHIARRYLVPRQVRENGLKATQASFSDAALRAIIEEYTREAGVRNLERQIGTVCRKLARAIAEGGPAGRSSVSAKRVRELLGRRGLLLGGTPADQPARGGHRARLDAGRRRGAVHRGDRDAGLREAHDHGPARRRHAGVRAGRALAAAGGRGAVPARPRAGREHLVLRARHPPARAGRRRAQGRPLGRGRDADRADLAAQRPAGRATTSR